MKFDKGSYAYRALDYARKVSKGKIPACWQIKAACQRTLNDLKRRDLVFSEPHINHVCEFTESLVHIKGEWAGEPIVLQPFQIWLLASIFGFIRKADGLRKHRSAFVLLPRKNGKSLLAAGIGLYMGFADGEAGAEVYCGASNLAQANEVFVPAKRMADMSPGFTDAFGVEVMARSIFSADSGSSFTPVIANTKDGSSPHCAICDELHQARDATQIQAFRTGMGARRQPLLLVISTAGFQLSGICRVEQLAAESMLRGQTRDDRLFAAIYTIDDDDDWKDFGCWRKANPNLGVTITEGYLREAYEKALQTPSDQAFARTKYLNQWVASAAGWLNMAQWAQAGDTALDIETLKGRSAWIGVDVSTKQDLTAIVVVVPLDDGRRAIFPFLFIPNGAVASSQNAPAYAGWVDGGHLIETPGNASSFAEVQAKLEDLCSHFKVQHIVLDQWQGENLRQNIAGLGIETSIWPANNRVQWTVTMDDFEADLKNGLLVHPNNPVLDWNAANTCAQLTGVTRVPVKSDRENKIDGMVTSLMAYAASKAAPSAAIEPVLFFV